MVENKQSESIAQFEHRRENEQDRDSQTKVDHRALSRGKKLDGPNRPST